LLWCRQLVVSVGEGPFARYYDVTDVTDEAFAAEQSRMTSERMARKGEKDDKKLATAAKRAAGAAAKAALADTSAPVASQP